MSQEPDPQPSGPQPSGPQVVVPGQAPEEGPTPEQLGEVVQQPGKLIRIATMIRELLEEARRAKLDAKATDRLKEIYERSISELGDVLSDDLQKEFRGLAGPLEGEPTEGEMRVVQAQLVGWLEGLFHGIQAALWTQHLQARAQFEEMRRRGLPSGIPSARPDGSDRPEGPPGQYL